MVKLKDITKEEDYDPNYRIPAGQVISHIIVREYLGYIIKPSVKNTNKKRYYYRCECTLCGRKDVIMVEDLLKYKLNQRSELACGCRKGRNVNPEFKKKSLNKYDANCKAAQHFSEISGRCYNCNNHSYRNYGGRGVSMCNEWKSPDGVNYLDNFCDWMYNEAGYTDDMGKEVSINRCNNNKDYSPNNCYLSYGYEQANNMRSNKYINWFGQLYTLAEVSKRFGKNQDTVGNRLINGYTTNEALFAPKTVNQFDKEMILANSPNGQLISSKPFTIVPFQFVDHSEIDSRDPRRLYEHPNHEQALNVMSYQARMKRIEQWQTPVKPFQFTNSGSDEFLLSEKERNWNFQF